MLLAEEFNNFQFELQILASPKSFTFHKFTTLYENLNWSWCSVCFLMNTTICNLNYFGWTLNLSTKALVKSLTFHCFKSVRVLIWSEWGMGMQNFKKGKKNIKRKRKKEKVYDYSNCIQSPCLLHRMSKVAQLCLWWDILLQQAMHTHKHTLEVVATHACGAFVFANVCVMHLCIPVCAWCIYVCQHKHDAFVFDKMYNNGKKKKDDPGLLASLFMIFCKYKAAII